MNSTASEAKAKEVDDECRRIAALPLAQREIERAKVVAKFPGVRASVIDQLVAGFARPAVNAEPVLFKTIDPSADAVDGGDLLDEIEAIFSRYLALPPGAADAMALWVLHAHTHDTSEVSPLLVFTSPTPECGKTTAMTLLSALVPKPLPASNITPAALFRSIEKWNPTLLIDEADTFLRGNDDLRGVIDSGHSRPFAYIIRSVGEDNEPTRFSTWAAKAIALIGRLSPTLASRAIHIEMKPLGFGESIEQFRADRLDFSETLSRAVRWSRDHENALHHAEPAMPSTLNGRRADNWRHIFAIADIAGGGWAERSRAAAATLSAVDSEKVIPVMLLA